MDWDADIATWWEEQYPHETAQVMNGGPFLADLPQTKLQEVMPGFPTFYLVDTGMSVMAMQLDNGTPEGAYNALIQANAL